MRTLTTHRFTVDEYHRMAEAGLLKADDRVELLDGQIIDMMLIGPFHGGVNNRLARMFIKLANDRWHVAIQTPVRLDDHSEPQPDLMLLKPAPDDYTTEHPAPEDVLLLVEVADSTLNYDRSDKLPAYGRAGVAEVWLVNLPQRLLEVYREPHYTGYASRTVLREGQSAHPGAFPDVALDVSELFRQAK